MPTYSQGPRLLKGAIVAILPTSEQTTIAFQYNPYTLTRTLTPKQQNETAEGSQRATALRFSGAPEETLSLDIYLDASDALERGDSTAARLGIYPQLSVLEMLAYPASGQVVQNDNLLKQGRMEVASGYDAPLVLFVWGPQRVLPVKITSLTVTEENFDPQLNPIQATVKLGLRALSYSDLDPSHKGYSLFLAYQKNKEQLAQKQGKLNGSTTDILGVESSRLR